MASIKYYDVILKPIITEKSMSQMSMETTVYKKEKVVVDGKTIQRAMKDNKGKFIKDVATVRKYAFYVHTEATKGQIKEAVEKMFDGVKVESIRTAHIVPSSKRVGKYTGKTAEKKKAIVTLTADSKDIELFAKN